MRRHDLDPYLRFEVEKWSSKSCHSLQHELAKPSVYSSVSGLITYYTEVSLVETRPDGVLVSVSVASSSVPWSVLYPLSAKFAVYENGRVEK